MRGVIPFMELMNEAYFILYIHLQKPEVFCKVFEDNQGFISAAECNKLSSRTKHIAIKYHHFRIFAQKKIVQICYIDTQEQTAVILTNPLDEALFIYLQIKLSRW